MGCSKCDSTHVVNKWFSLCRECNNERLHGSKYGKQVDYKAKESNPLKTSKSKSTNKRIVDKGKRVISSGNKKSKSFQTILLDEIFYEKCFNLSNNKCEECKTKLPDEFRDAEGKVIYRARYSHIIPKSIAPELRHVAENINHLCIECHHKWDFGAKKEMKIYTKNQELFPRYLKHLESND